MIQVENLQYAVADKTILNQLNVEIPKQAITVILGPNGSGKTSLLGCLNGHIAYQSGSVTLHNNDIKHYSLLSLARQLATLSQLHTINFPFTAFDIVMMGRYPYENLQNKAIDEQIVTQAMQSVDVLQYKNRKISTLSGGEQQRVHLARTYLLDEPISALDFKHQHQLLTILKQVKQQQQATVVLVLHDLHIAKLYADHIVLLNHGRVHCSGSVDACLTKTNIEQVFEVAYDKVLR